MFDFQLADKKYCGFYSMLKHKNMNIFYCIFLFPFVGMAVEDAVSAKLIYDEYKKIKKL
jgi:hypothetical protein